jgi:hypothetical protein
MNLLLEALKELLTEEPKSIGCMFVNDKAIVYLEYSAVVNIQLLIGVMRSTLKVKI